MGDDSTILSSIADLYLDTSVDLTGEDISADKHFELRDCDQAGNLKSVETQLKQRVIDGGISKCFDLNKAKVSGGTLDQNNEHIIVIAWEHCEKFKPSNECATTKEKSDFFANIKVSLAIVENYIEFHEPDTIKTIKSKIQDTLLVDTR